MINCLRATSFAFVVATLAGAAAHADGGTTQEALRPGAYEIEFRLEMPHLEWVAASRQAAICVRDRDLVETQGLGAVSDNNPLSACPATNMTRAQGALEFDIACPGANAARGHARYLIGTDRFDGRIDMKMGGKNMTMTEVQSGRRRGDCSSAAKPAPDVRIDVKPQMQHRN